MQNSIFAAILLFVQSSAGSVIFKIEYQHAEIPHNGNFGNILVIKVSNKGHLHIERKASESGKKPKSQKSNRRLSEDGVAKFDAVIRKVVLKDLEDNHKAEDGPKANCSENEIVRIWKGKEYKAIRIEPGADCPEKLSELISEMNRLK